MTQRQTIGSPAVEEGCERPFFSPHLRLVAAGLLLGLAGVATRLNAAAGDRLFAAGVMLAFFGFALAIAGAVSLLFAWATRRSVEWFVAWRYLQRMRRARGTLVVGVVLLVASAAAYLMAQWAGHEVIGGIPLEPTTTARVLKGVALGVAVLGWLVTVFGALLLAFSVFTCISIFGVHLGTAALVVVLSVMGGFEEDLRNKILGTRAHVVVTKPQKMFADYGDAMKKIDSLEGVVAVSPYLESEVMVTSQTNLAGVLLRGIDPQRIGRVSDLRSYLAAEGGSGNLDNLTHPDRLARIPSLSPTGAGRLRPPSEAPEAAAGAEGSAREEEQGEDARLEARIRSRATYPGVIIGAELARNLSLYVGDDINLVAPLGGMSPAGPIPKSRPFRVAGIFYSGMYEYDTKLAYATVEVAQRFLGLDDEITGVEVKVHDVTQAITTATRIEGHLGGDFEVRDWRALNRSLFSALKLEKIVMFVVLTFIVIVASFSIVTNLIMVVLEKGREIATLKALGATSASVLRVFIFAGLYIGVLGMVVGVTEGVAICTFLAHVGLPLDPEVYYIAQLPVRMSPPDIAAVAGAGVLLSLGATAYPALRASRLRPVDGLRPDA